MDGWREGEDSDFREFKEDGVGDLWKIIGRKGWREGYLRIHGWIVRMNDGEMIHSLDG